MRLRRLCEVKKSGKSHVSDEVRTDYKGGGEKREWLEIALLEAIKKHGTHRDNYKKVKAHRVWEGLEITQDPCRIENFNKTLCHCQTIKSLFHESSMLKYIN